MKRREFIKAGGGAALVASLGRTGLTGSDQPGTEVAELSISEIQQAMTAGHLSSAGLLEKYLERIRTIDRNGPKINSIMELNPEAGAEAAALDNERRTKGPRGPLHGIPLLLKDNIDTRGPMRTSAGSLALAEHVAAADAFIVQRLRQAGAVIMGKTNLSEWANFRADKSTSGWSSRGGQTRNPYALDRNPCGSSSGSAAAVAASLCSAAVGTETDGSIVSPASCCGVVGIKPTLGLLSRSGIIPIAHSQDTAGPMARSVADAAILLAAMAGVDPSDPETGRAQAHIRRDYSDCLDPRGLAGARIGVPRRFFSLHHLLDPLLEETLQQLRGLGAELVDLPEAFAGGEVWRAEMEVLLYEFKHDLNLYLGRSASGLETRNLAELIAFNEKHRRQVMPYFGQELLIRAQAKGPLSEQAYLDARHKARSLTRENGIDAAVKAHRLDALVAPTIGPACVTDLVCGDRFFGGSSWVAAVAGYPSISVPALKIYGLPVGLSFFGPAWSEARLISLAYAFEQGAGPRLKPGFLVSSALPAKGA